MSTKLVSVLVVGESAKGSSFLLQRLEKRGCECHVATSSAEAVRLFAGHGFDLVLCTDWMQGINTLIAALLGSPASLFRCHPVEDSCWWLPTVRHGEKCQGAPALRPAEFGCALEGLVEEIQSGRHLLGEIADWGIKPQQVYTEAAPLGKP